MLSQNGFLARPLKIQDWCFSLVSVSFWRSCAGWAAEEGICDFSYCRSAFAINTCPVAHLSCQFLGYLQLFAFSVLVSLNLKSAKYICSTIQMWDNSKCRGYTVEQLEAHSAVCGPPAFLGTLREVLL